MAIPKAKVETKCTKCNKKVWKDEQGNLFDIFMGIAFQSHAIKCNYKEVKQ